MSIKDRGYVILKKEEDQKNLVSVFRVIMVN